MTQKNTTFSQDSPSSRRILIVRLSAHGDVIHTLPLLAAIKRQVPHNHAGWLVERSAAPLLQGHPDIDTLHVCDRKRWWQMMKNPLQWPSVLQEVMSFIRELRDQRYDISLDAQGLFKSAVWPFLAGIPKRYGFSRTRENAAMFYNRPLPPILLDSGKRKAVDQYLDLVRAIDIEPAESGFVLPPVGEAARHKISALLPAHSPIVVVAPFTRWASKHWEPAYWQDLIRALLAMDLGIVLVGSPADQLSADIMLGGFEKDMENDRLVNLTGKTDWPDLFALFENAALVIGLDSAPLHIADAVGHPKLIGLYGPTAPGRTGPTGSGHTILSTTLSCQPCFQKTCPLRTHDCMRLLEPESVVAAARLALFGQAQVLP